MNYKYKVVSGKWIGSLVKKKIKGAGKSQEQGLESVLNDYGSKGWELVAMEGEGCKMIGSSQWSKYVFKKPIATNNS